MIRSHDRREIATRIQLADGTRLRAGRQIAVAAPTTAAHSHHEVLNAESYAAFVDETIGT